MADIMTQRLLAFSARTLRDVGRGLLDLVYPPVCLLCAEPLPAEAADFCPACVKALTQDPHPACPRCARSVGPFTDTTAGCPSCRAETLHFDAAIRLGLYPAEGRLRDAVLRIKHAMGETLAHALGRLWARTQRARFQQFGVTHVVPVPLHWWRQWRRGYNQSAALAEGIAGELQLPLHKHWLRRVRHTPIQTGQTPAGRRANVQGAFRARNRPGIRGAAVLLVDDVLTTGSTCCEAAKALRGAGAARIVVAALTHSAF